MRCVFDGSTRSIGDDRGTSTSSVARVVESLTISAADWIVLLVLAFVLARVGLSVVQVTCLVSFLGHALAVEFTFVFVSDIVHSADWQINVKTIAFLAFLQSTSSVRGLLGSSTGHEAFVVVGLTVHAADFLDHSLAEVALVHGLTVADSFVELGDAETI